MSAKNSKSKGTPSARGPQDVQGNRGTAVAESVLRMPFDQYQRYRLVADLLAHLDGGRGELRVLDVGGRTARLREFLPGIRVDLVDVEPSESEGLVLGSGGALPFREDAFDVVAAFDTLEHVPPPIRDDFVKECARVARRYVVIAGPYAAPRVDRAEELLQQFLRDKLGSEHRYLNEHRDHGLPVREHTEGLLREAGARVRSLGHGNIDRWLAMMCAALYMDDDPALRGLAAEMNAFYNEALYATDHVEPVYRHVVVAAFGKADPLPTAEELLDPPGAPEGTLAAFQPLTDGLVHFDRERAAWREERARRKQAVEDLEEDLAGHAESLEEARTEVREQAKVIETLEEDLEGNRKTVAELEEALAEHVADLETHRRQLETQRREAAEDRATLEADLAEHRRSIEDLERDLATQRESAEQARREALATQSTLEADLAEHKKSMGDLAEEVVALRELLEKNAAEGEAVRRALLDQIEAHRAAHEQVVQSYELLAADRDGIQAHRDELIGEVDRVNALASELNQQLVDAAGVREDLQRNLVLRAREVELLHGSMRDRRANLKRALQPKDKIEYPTVEGSGDDGEG